MNREYFSDINSLQQYVKTHKPSLYLGSQTSTVIPFENLPDSLKNLTFCYLEKMPQKLNLLENGNLEILGPVNWHEARVYLRSLGRDLLTFPTEELAAVLAGIATSATGERCFGYGTFRSQVLELDYINYKGEIKTLKKDKKFEYGNKSLRENYQKTAKSYQQFKNPPFPNFDNEIDLMIGTEGQLGVITRAIIETKKLENSLFLLIPLKSKWTDNFDDHMKLYDAVQNKRDELICVELLDYNCINYLSAEDNIPLDKDYIVLEVLEKNFESLYENFLCSLDFIDLDQIVELSASKFMAIRQKIPRLINEKNSQAGIKKLGTDIQAVGENFKDLLGDYKILSQKGIHFCLFGHFGDGHLHFNFMPEPSRSEEAKEMFVSLYKKLSQKNISPFAEHGIGVIKQDFIRDYYSQAQIEFFKNLKSEFDPHNQFFPLGFMNISLSV